MATPAKRSRVEHACQSCIRSKVRCQEQLPTGCKRCRRRETECSLKIVLQNTCTPSLDSPVSPEALSLLSMRVKQLESQLSISSEHQEFFSESNLTPSSLTSNCSTSKGSIPSPVVAPDADNGPLIVDLIKSFVPSAKSNSYPDIVKEGVIHREQLDVAFQLFVPQSPCISSVS
jgi:hypothetical protein